jgi:hypothetical protein
MELCAAIALQKLLRFETLHNFFLGLPRSLRVSSSEMLKDSSLLATEQLNATGSAPKLKSARVNILKMCNAFLRRVNTDSPCLGLNIDFSKAGTNDVLSGFFTATGITAMLEAKDLAGADQDMPFELAPLDRLCGTTGAAKKTSFPTLSGGCGARLPVRRGPVLPPSAIFSGAGCKSVHAVRYSDICINV